ncbi:DedA family protein [Loktanella sp. IMCC34160]|uniref:DedA family protein n=1 Tax=Loktanella sp. IMCC34160 TaxID=2510646 RepID=UPI00101D7E83|nr:VTT domain-containing protein [Loktanella sp. IMCC34160]RYG90846.1 DedA family protein [Loktanella sp. IMCC34160]
METVLSLITTYGVAALFLGTFLSCLALPVPSSLMMLAGGAFAASGDLDLYTVTGAAWVGAVLGDQVGYGIGRIGGRHLSGWMARHPKRGAILQKAQDKTREWGGIGVYLSRWLFSPLGPYVNLAAGIAGMRWPRFFGWDMAGEATWVAVYVGLGFVFAGQISAIADIAGNLSGLLAAGAVTIGLGIWLWRRADHAQSQRTR